MAIARAKEVDSRPSLAVVSGMGQRRHMFQKIAVAEASGWKENRAIAKYATEDHVRGKARLTG